MMPMGVRAGIGANVARYAWPLRNTAASTAITTSVNALRSLAALLLLCVAWGSSAQLAVPGVSMLGDYADARDCYVLAPAAPRDTLGLVVFIHGYGALNPLNYGAWLQEVLDCGNAVILPRYQRNLIVPGTRRFVANAVAGIRRGLDLIGASGLPVDTSRVVYVGHSYGGALSAHLLARGTDYGLPPAYGALLAAPGTSRFRGARLDDYGEIAPGTQLAIVAHAGDRIVGDELAQLVYATAGPDVPRILVEQDSLAHADAALGQGHNECYGVDLRFDTGYRNYTTRKALRVGRVDANDRDLYWPLTHALLRGFRQNAAAEWPLLSDGRLYYGRWPDGSVREPLPVRQVRRPASRAAASTPADRRRGPRGGRRGSR